MGNDMNMSKPVVQDLTASIAPFEISRVRRDFPILSRSVHGKPLVYFDTASSAQRPLAVIEAVDQFYRNHNANVHRGVHTLSQEATDLYEAARLDLANYINADSIREVIFTRGSTESINLVAQSFYLWVNVYNLFVVSVFWSFMTDVFDDEQAKRMFGFIAAGGSAGATSPGTAAARR